VLIVKELGSCLQVFEASTTRIGVGSSQTPSFLNAPICLKLQAKSSEKRYDLEGQSQRIEDVFSMRKSSFQEFTSLFE
jgi:hypothetical protein